MTRAPLRHARFAAAFVGCLVGAGCAGIDPPAQGPGAARTPTGQAVAPTAAMEAIVIGQSSKAEVAAALGPAVVVRFDSGYEVWVYRWPGADPTARAATELVVLFAPSGPATKVRLRPGYPARR